MAPPTPRRKLSVYESENELKKSHAIGQIAAVRWLDENNAPRWYITVIVGQTDTGYEVRWQDDIYKVDLDKDETVFQFNNDVCAFFQRHPQATSITIAGDVYLVNNPDDNIHTCIEAINCIRMRRDKLPVTISGVQEALSLAKVADMVPHNKVMFD